MIIKSVFSRSIILTIILVVGSIMSYGQENEWTKHQIKFSPVRTINWFSPGLELSYELGYGKFSTQLSGAYLIDIFNEVGRGSNFTGYRLNLEQKYLSLLFYFFVTPILLFGDLIGKIEVTSYWPFICIVLL